ncbi:amidohydrolase family protein [Sphingomonas corticis]|uniref:Amidohydrolase family protein n=1 Tax=Sphingomonas corticis TaxID=2722791 RepID=A0ABX1CRM6_9SPHN|nr:amidohydrolase family protein [Sphingomonas corticis]NJR80607.1 amidohydrolase family protein [Sphingomonas corticis]
MLIVDAQIHLWSTPGGPPHHRSEPYTADEAVREMDAAGVSRSINCPAIWDPRSNEYAQEAVASHPGRFGTMGWLPLDTAPDPEVVERLLGRPGMLGLRFVLMTPAATVALGAGDLDWIWEVANRLGRPVALMVPRPMLGTVGDLARRFGDINFLVDHLAIGPHDRMPAAAEDIDQLLSLATLPNVAAKATATPGFSAEPFPHQDVAPVLKRVYDAFGPQRMFWGTDFTRMPITLQQCVEMFTLHLPWLRGDELEAVMGRAVCDWVGWERG